MKDLTKDVDIQIMHDGYDDNCIISYSYDAVFRLRPGKYDGHLGLSCDHVRQACDELYVHFSMLMSAVIVHGCVTEDLSVSTVLPNRKGKNLNFSDSHNYRGIASSSIPGKMLDVYVNNRYDSNITTSSQQFGFKKGHLTSMFSMILKETLEYYRQGNNTVYCRLLC